MNDQIIHNIRIKKEKTYYGVFYIPCYYFIEADMQQTYPYKTEIEAYDHVIRQLVYKYKKVFNIINGNNASAAVCIPFGVFKNKKNSSYYYKKVDNSHSKQFKTEIQAYRAHMKYLLTLYRRINKILVAVP